MILFAFTFPKFLVKGDHSSLSVQDGEPTRRREKPGIYLFEAAGKPPLFVRFTAIPWKVYGPDFAIFSVLFVVSTRIISSSMWPCTNELTI